MKIIFVSLVFLGCGSQSQVAIPDVKIYKEIPFVDGSEGISYTIRSEEIKRYNVLEWEAKRHELISVDYEGWGKIKQSWYSACRYALINKRKCDLALQSFGDTITRLDDIGRQVFRGVVPQ